MTNISYTTDVAAIAARPVSVPLVPQGQGDQDSVSFSDVLDAVNPLQHIPVVSSVYRAATGSGISPFSQIAGAAIFGGLTGGILAGVAVSVADVAIKEATGKNVAEHAVAVLEGTQADASGAKGATPLVPLEGALPVAQTVTSADAAALEAKAAEAASLILRSNASASKVAAQYQRAQTLDIASQLLLKAL